MKKAKEFLLFVIALTIPIVFYFLILLFVDLFAKNPQFVGLVNYINMFIADEYFVKALLHTLIIPIIISFLALIFFAFVTLAIRKKIKSPRLLFYLVGGIISVISTLIFLIISRESFAIGLVFMASYVTIFSAFVFWIFELVIEFIKTTMTKKSAAEKEG